MSVQAWLSGLGRLPPLEPEHTVRFAPLADRLATLDDTMRTAPDAVRNAYRLLRESELVAAAERRIAALESGDMAFEVVEAAAPVGLVRPLAVEIRAVDELLRRNRPKDAPSDPDLEYRTRTDPARFVVPCRERRLGRRGRDGQGYDRRGLLRHRVLPVRIGAYRVRLHGGGALAAADEVGPPPFLGGAALFSGLVLDFEDLGPDLFRVVGARTADTLGDVSAHLDAAALDGCTAVVWPELAVAPEVLAAIATRLRENSDRPGALGSPLRFVVAGSWHTPDMGGYVNRATVLDAYGEPLLVFDKMVASHFEGYGSEDIAESRTLEVLLLEDELVAFGICYDFCDSQPDNPFLRLDADLVVVPSMGNPRTMDGHLRTALRVVESFAAGCFVVQQAEPQGADELGFVVPPIPRLLGSTAETLRQTTTWRAYAALSEDGTSLVPE